MKSVRLQQSIHDLPPLEIGGVIARAGFTFQDHVAVSFCLDMLSNPDLCEVWCETQDDITLIRAGDDYQEVEFVQVKDLHFDHLWTVAELCKRSSRGLDGVGTSILEKSLAQDRCSEPCCFRMVTSWQVNKDLDILTLPLISPGRECSSDHFGNLCKEVSRYVPDFRSTNGNDYEFWLSRTTWQIEHSVETVETRNVQVLEDYAASFGFQSKPTQIRDQVYPRLLDLVRKAAETDWRVDREAKKHKQETFRTWLNKVLTEVQYPAAVGAGENMQRKMEAASLPTDYIETAHGERRRYRQELLSPRYLDVSDRDLVISEVNSELKHLRVKLDTGEFAEGMPFYRACLDKMKELQHSLTTTNARVPLFFLDGCMYDVTDRCEHRYRRLST